MKNLINNKSSFATALSRLGRVLSLIAIGLAFSASALGTTFGIMGDTYYGLKNTMTEMNASGSTFTYSYDCSQTGTTWFRLYKNQTYSDSYCVYNSTETLTLGTTYSCTVGTYRQFRASQTAGKTYTVTVVYTSDSDVDVTITEATTPLSITSVRTLTNQVWVTFNQSIGTTSDWKVSDYQTNTHPFSSIQSIQENVKLYFHTGDASTTKNNVYKLEYGDYCFLVTLSGYSYGEDKTCTDCSSSCASTTTAPTVRIGKKPTVSGTSATINLQMADWGCADVESVNVYYSTSGEPSKGTTPWSITLDDPIDENTNFDVVKSSISAGTYYIKVAAVNSADEGELSDMATFTISGCDAPSLTAAYNSSKTSSSITAAATVTAAGTCGSISAFGVEYSTNSSCSSATKVAGSTPTVGVAQNIQISGLAANTRYYYRTYATVDGTDYYSTIQNDFTLPTYTTSATVNSSTSATVTGTINAGGNAVSTADSETCKMEISTTDNFSNIIQTFNWNGVVGTAESSTKTDLTAGTTYYYRMKAKFTDNGHQTTDVISEVKNFKTNSVFSSVSIEASASVCKNGTFTLTKSATPAATSWTFTSNNTGVATVTDEGVITGKGTGTCTITGTAHKDGYDDMSKTCSVTVNDKPAQPGEISGTTTLCAGTSSNSFSIAEVSGATSYTWSVVSGSMSVAGSGASCTVTTNNDYDGGSIQVIATNTCGNSDARTLVLTKVAAPTVSLSGDASVCSGSNITITAAVTGATSYSWSTPAGWTKTADAEGSATYTAAGSGSYTVTYTATNSCGVQTQDSKTITVNTVLGKPGTITCASSVFCPTSKYMLSIDAVSGATGYTWAIASGTRFGITRQDDQTKCEVATGSDFIDGGTVTVTADNGCGSSEASEPYTLHGPVTPTVSLSASSTEVCAGATVTITATASNVSTCEWSVPDGWTKTASDLTSATYTTGGSGSATVTYTAKNSCGATGATATQSVTVNALPTISLGDAATVYPWEYAEFTPTISTGASITGWTLNSTAVTLPASGNNYLLEAATGGAYHFKGISSSGSSSEATFTVGATVTDSNACTATTTKTITVSAKATEECN